MLEGGKGHWAPWLKSGGAGRLAGSESALCTI